MNSLIKKNINFNELKERKRNIATKDLANRNRNRVGYSYKKYQLVLVKDPTPDKLDERWQGPYAITRARNRRNYVVIETETGQVRVNIKRIKPFKRGKHVV
ncbi:hypothetical protein NGRA_1655 [Nosema granulosis]|uniref:Uncharacterized protein n=1 Tax=Nosema granulosis TaxID=83296 RepID=A0A9P6H0T7_9MICR|nr:hypothetical protein NGRA_1655 [Nosema granulosis]